MKHTTLRSPHPYRLPLAWRETEYAALQAEAADTFDDRVSQNIFDIEDEHAEVDIVVRGMAHN
jgi:hypothetical protein